MKSNDRRLGMDRDISRRDFINGVALAAGSLALPSSVLGLSEASSPGQDYPPARMGMRGSHPGSFEVAHELQIGRAHV